MLQKKPLSLAKEAVENWSIRRHYRLHIGVFFGGLHGTPVHITKLTETREITPYLGIRTKDR